MPETFILIPGRTSRQGCGISEGKCVRDRGFVCRGIPDDGRAGDRDGRFTQLG